jgi:hypothetical protein
MIAAGVSCAHGDVLLLFTADTEGRIRACPSCSTVGGLGDIARRATAIAAERRANPALLLADAGNFLFGLDSLASGGRVIIAAYDALAYDAVNLSYRDFRLGKDATVALLRSARFPVISANLCDATTGRLLAAPFAIRRAGGVRVALVGVSELPAGVASLPHVSAQLAGVRVVPPIEALTEWLPKAHAEADRVVLLFYGSASGLDTVNRAFGRQLVAVLVGGLRPPDLPARSEPPVAATQEFGTLVARIELPATGPVKVTQIRVDGSVEADPRMLDLLTRFAEPGARPQR